MDKPCYERLSSNGYATVEADLDGRWIRIDLRKASSDRIITSLVVTFAGWPRIRDFILEAARLNEAQAVFSVTVGGWEIEAQAEPIGTISFPPVLFSIAREDLKQLGSAVAEADKNILRLEDKPPPDGESPRRD